MTRAVRPYGSWTTPITSELVVQDAVAFGEVELAGDPAGDPAGDTVFWLEMRPAEGGLNQVVRWTRETGPADVLPTGTNVRTAAHEYGGGAWWLADGRGWFAEWSDQRLREFDPYAGGPSPVVTVTPDPDVPRGDRWADGELDAGGRWLLVVREHHPTATGITDVVNEIVAVDTGSAHPPVVLVSGPDFVSDPRLSPDGRHLSWLQWRHPDMPWDGTELCLATFRIVDDRPAVGEPTVVAGRPNSDSHGESVFQPRWARNGSLWFVSDRTGWWNLYRIPAADDATVEVMVEIDADIGVPQWQFRSSRFAFLDGDRVVFAYQRLGLDHLAVRSPAGEVVDLELPYTAIGGVKARGGRVAFVAASGSTEPALVRLTLDGTVIVDHEVLSPPRDLGLDPAWFSLPQPITFPTASSDGRGRDEVAHALYYAPTNPDTAGPEGSAPPLLVLIHGGPTGAARPFLSLGVQYWTSRGFAVVDVNYRGSCGFGRAYRDRLRNSWGVIDLDDCEGAARHLVEQGLADPDRLCIMGGSAGGYTTLAALAFRDTFAAGADLFGLADLEVFAGETHKFESRYLDGLFGPYPECRDVYAARSPIRHLDRFDRPLIVFQGLEDEVVPPNQSEMIVEALRERGIPVAYVAFAGEQHGFRQAANIRRSLDGTLSFFAQVFRFELPAAEAIEPVTIENADALDGPRRRA